MNDSFAALFKAIPLSESQNRLTPLCGMSDSENAILTNQIEQLYQRLFKLPFDPTIPPNVKLYQLIRYQQAGLFEKNLIKESMHESLSQ